MDSVVKELLDILKATLLNKDIKVTISDPKKLYFIAKENGLSGTIYPRIKNVITNEKVLSKFKKEFYLYVSEDNKKTEIKNLITDRFNQSKIDHIYLKGMRLKNIYPETYMRSMGDIDLIVPTEDFDMANKKLLALGFKLDSKGPVHNVYFYGNTEIEIHISLRENSKFEEYQVLDEVWNHSKLLNNYEYQINPEFEIIYLLFHLKKHILFSGVGLRNILDIGIYLNHYQKFVDNDLLESFLVKTKSKIFFEQILLFNEKYLDLTLASQYNISVVFDEELYEVFTKYVIKSGVHGLGMGFNTFISRFASIENDNSSRSKSILRTIFPSYNTLKYQYPKILKFKVLLPVVWLLRAIRVLFKQTKRIVIYFKLVKRVNDADVKTTANLFKKMGI